MSDNATTPEDANAAASEAAVQISKYIAAVFKRVNDGERKSVLGAKDVTETDLKTVMNLVPHLAALVAAINSQGKELGAHGYKRREAPNMRLHRIRSLPLTDQTHQDHRLGSVA